MLCLPTCWDLDFKPVGDSIDCEKFVSWLGIGVGGLSISPMNQRRSLYIQFLECHLARLGKVTFKLCTRRVRKAAINKFKTLSSESFFF